MNFTTTFKEINVRPAEVETTSCEYTSKVISVSGRELMYDLRRCHTVEAWIFCERAQWAS